MMGFPVPSGLGAFFASCDHRSGDLIVKLPDSASSSSSRRARQAVRPGRAAFREWVLIDDRHPARWAELIDEARLFVAGNQ